MMKKAALMTGLVTVSVLLLPLMPHQTAEAQFRSDAIDVILVVDTSLSMKDNDPQKIRISAAKLFVDLSGDGDRIGIVSMSGEEHTEIVAGLTSISTWLDQAAWGRRTLKDALDVVAVTEEWGTFMGSALRHAYNMLDQTGPGRRQFVVLLTDGLHYGESEQVLDDVLADFENRRFWKIFPIALGEEADFEFLETEVAGRTGGQAYKAATPEELIRVYTEIFAAMRYNAYVNFIPMQMGTLQDLATVAEEQQVTSLAFAVPRSAAEGPLPIETLISPADVNLVDPAYAGGVYHAFDSRYEAWVVEPHAVLLDGTWQVRLLGDGTVDVAVLIRSELGIQLSAPPPQYSWDELSARYAPTGHPALLNIGVVNAALPSQYAWDPGFPSGIEGQLERFLSPVVRITSPEEGEWLTLSDAGQDADMAKEDGQYTGLYHMPGDAQEYVLEVEIPFAKEDPIRLFKDRVLESKPLPVVSVEVPTTERVVPDTPIPVAIAFLQPSGAQVPINSADVSVLITEPNGNRYEIDLTEEADRFVGSFTPSVEGPYQVGAWANIRVNMEGEEITYTDFAQVSYGAEAIQSLLVQAEETTITADSLKDIPVTVAITSESLEEQELKVSVEGLEGGSVLPGRITVPPQDISTFTFKVSGSEDAAGGGQFALVFASDDASVVVENAEVTFDYQVPSGFCASSLLSIGVLVLGLLTIIRMFAGG
jgi:hypothetical protein